MKQNNMKVINTRRAIADKTIQNSQVIRLSQKMGLLSINLILILAEMLVVVMMIMVFIVAIFIVIIVMLI